jgi:hypothetical protein
LLVLRRVVTKETCALLLLRLRRAASKEACARWLILRSAAAEETGTLRLVLGARVPEDGAHLDCSLFGLVLKKMIVGEAMLFEVALRDAWQLGGREWASGEMGEVFEGRNKRSPSLLLSNFT